MCRYALLAEQLAGTVRQEGLLSHIAQRATCETWNTHLSYGGGRCL